MFFLLDQFSVSHIIHIFSLFNVYFLPIIRGGLGSGSDPDPSRMKSSRGGKRQDPFALHHLIWLENGAGLGQSYVHFP